jgi:8-oxo-dGTP diphosphatase
MKDYFKIIPAVYVVLKKGDEILLLRRYKTGYLDGNYSLPAGHIDGNEPAIMAAIREANEEVGINLKPGDLKLVHTLHRTSDIPNRHERIDLFFRADKWQGEVKNNEPEKCDELLWTRIDKLPENMVPEVRYALEKIAASTTYSDFSF